MKFEALDVVGAYVVIPTRKSDERGFFARTFCTEEFARLGFDSAVAQCNISFNWARGTVRGLHYQAKPYEETKLVRCTRGAAFDVLVDLRPDSNTYCKWTAVEITADNRYMVYVPKGVAHGFQTLLDETELFYQISVAYAPSSADGVRWDDPAFGIAWPLPCTKIAPRDCSYPDFRL